MDENHQDKVESKLTATEDIIWVLNKKNKLWMPKRKGTRKRMNALATFFKAWATPIGTVIAVGTLLWGVISFTLQQQSAQQQTLDQQQQTTLDTYLDRMSDLLLTYPEHFKAYKQGDQYQVIAEARTLTAVRNLD